MIKPLVTLCALLLSTAASAQTITKTTQYGPYTASEHIDFYAPIGKPIAGEAVLCIHGGALVSGSRTQANIVDFSKSFAKAGFATFSIDYRLVNNTNHWPAPIQDVQLAVRYIRSLGYKTVIVAGKSSGGYLSLFAGALGDQIMVNTASDPLGEAQLYPNMPNHVDAVIDVSGPKDQAMYQADVGDSSGSPVYLKSAGLAANAAGYAKISPRSYQNKLMPPTISFEGSKDPHVTVDQANEWHKEALALGNVHQLVTGNFGHVFLGAANDGANCVEEAIRFAIHKRVVLNNPLCLKGS